MRSALLGSPLVRVVTRGHKSDGCGEGERAKHTCGASWRQIQMDGGRRAPRAAKWPRSGYPGYSSSPATLRARKWKSGGILHPETRSIVKSKEITHSIQDGGHSYWHGYSNSRSLVLIECFIITKRKRSREKTFDKCVQAFLNLPRNGSLYPNHRSTNNNI